MRRICPLCDGDGVTERGVSGVTERCRICDGARSVTLRDDDDMHDFVCAIDRYLTRVLGRGMDQGTWNDQAVTWLRDIGHHDLAVAVALYCSTEA